MRPIATVVAIAFIGVALALVQPAAFAGAADVEGPPEEDWLAVVTFADHPIVGGAAITLGDIAEITTDDPHVAAALHELTVGRAPLPGQQRVIHIASVRTRMRQQRLPVARILLQSEGPELTVGTRANDVPASLLASAATEAVTTYVAAAGVAQAPDANWSVDCALSDGVTVPAGTLDVQARRISGSAPGSVVVALEVAVDGAVERTVMLRCHTELELDVLIVAADAKRHDVLTTEHFNVERRTFSSLPRGGLLPLHVVERPEDWRTTRPVRPGTVLTGSMVERVPAIAKGGSVNIVASLDGIVVSVPGVALADGRPGDVIRVENELSGQIVQAVVVDEREVHAVLY